jgi:hypothetical protein
MIKFIFAAATLLTSSFSWALVGGDESAGTRGGGNMVASEFYDTGIEILKALEPRSPATANGKLIDAAVLNGMFQETILSVSDKNLYLNGSLVDAINEPAKNRIQISGPSWVKLNKDKRYRLVAHEILGLARIPDVQYKTSQELLNIAYVGINWDLGYRPACSGLRFLSNEKSQRVFTAIRAFFNYKSGLNNFSVPSFTCVHSVNLQGFEYSHCDLDSGTYRADVLHENLMNALEFAGVAKYTTGPNGQKEVYSTDGVACSAGSQIRCSIKAYWNSGCPTTAK